MSAGNNGAGMPPEHDDDPFASLYRSEGDPAGVGDQAGAPRRLPSQPPRQTSYHQVRPVGERTYAGQRPQGPPGQYRPPQPDAYYAAPETQSGGPGPGGPPTGRRRAPAPEPRRNGLLIGAIAVVLAVVVGVGAAIIFSNDESNPEEGAGGPTGGGQDVGGNDGGADPTGDDDDTPPDPTQEELPAADLAALELGGSATLDSTVSGAASPDGSYITGLNSPGASITWEFDLKGDPGQYYLYTTYSAISDGQTLSFSINGDPRDDPIDLKDWATATDEWEESWVRTYNFVDLEPGTNRITMSCVDSCDVLIDQIFLTTEKL